MYFYFWFSVVTLRCMNVKKVLYFSFFFYFIFNLKLCELFVLVDTCHEQAL